MEILLIRNVALEHTVTIERRLRPLRLAFLSEPNDRGTLRKIFELNTCLWGGRYNAIIPFFRRTPPWWADGRIGLASADKIREGYKRAFEPDFLVTPWISKSKDDWEILETRILGVDEAYAKLGNFGASVADLYQHMYSSRFQFQLKNPPKFLLPFSSDSRFNLFIMAVFGSLPSSGPLGYVRTQYINAFSATQYSVSESSFFGALTTPHISPLRVGSDGLTTIRRCWRPIATIFLMDALRTRDLIDFWNLRALGWRVLPIPIQWANSMIAACTDFIERNAEPVFYNPSHLDIPIVLKSRSISTKDLNEFAHEITPSFKQPISIHHLYPRIWDDCRREDDHAIRCDVMHSVIESEQRISNGSVSFSSLCPDFLRIPTLSTLPSWANVISVRDYNWNSEFAHVFPQGMTEVCDLLGTYDRLKYSITSEGIVVLGNLPGNTHRWTLPDGLSVFRSWFESNGCTVLLSGAGKITQQLIRSLGGIRGSYAIAYPDVIRLLNNMAHGDISEDNLDHTDNANRTIRRRTVSRNTLWSVFHKVNKANEKLAEQHLDRLIQCGAFRLGLELQCPHCSQHNWYELRLIEESVKCERCLQMYDFPLLDPPRKSSWQYRTQGPFSVENYAQGAYSVALSLRFIGREFNYDATWVPSLALSKVDGTKLEMDFAMWIRKAYSKADYPRLLIGECKTYSQFEMVDVQRARMIVREFHGSTFVFATLKNELGNMEKRILAAFCQTGRHPITNNKWKYPVLILTGCELLAQDGPPLCWRGHGGKFDKLAEAWKGRGELEELCDATQQLHLDMEPYSDYEHRYYEEMRQRGNAQTRR